MGFVGILLPVTPPPPQWQARRSTTISSALAGVLTLTVTSPEVEHSGLGREWVEIKRAGNLPILRDAGPKLRKYRLEAILYVDPTVGDVADDLEVLARHAQAPEVTVTYGSWETATAVITDITFKTRNRVQGTNEPYWAEVSLEITIKPPELRQLVPAPVPSAAPPPPPPAPAPGPSASSTPSRPSTVTVKAGDTLIGISTRVYGNGGQWRKIADANKVRNPKRLAVGQVLRIP